MRRVVLEALLHELSRIANEHDLVMVGSQAVHAITDDAPVEVVMSRECDFLLDESDPLTAAIDQSLGPESPRAAETSVWVDTVSSTFPFLPAGWEQRVVSLAGFPHVRCLEIHDLVLSKLAAGRLKDYELIAVLLDRALADVAVVRDRIAAVFDLHMRAVLAARLQIILEGAPR